MRLILVASFSWILILLISTSQISAKAIDGCPQKCGNAKIPYPFGIGNGCFLSDFEVSCKPGIPTPIPFLPFLAGTQFQILNISNGKLSINSTHYIATDCVEQNRTLTHISLPEDGPFTISDESNSFMAIGCDTVAVIANDDTFTSGCVSLCTHRNSVANGSCSGAGCCQSGIPKGAKYLGLGASNMFGYMNVSSFNNCSYAFVVERGSFTFMESDLRDFLRIADISMTLDWSIGNHDCSGMNSNVCGQNSVCVDSVGGFGYLCNCTDGYVGNPYLNGSKGCQDADECLNSETSPCVTAARCHNEVPGYSCICPFGSTGDGTRHGSGCRKIFQVVEAVLGTVLGFSVMLLCGLWFYFVHKKRTLIKLKEQYFLQNGGLLLKQQVSTREGADCARIFSSAELKQATQNYDDTKIIGTGGYGTVYKGILEDGTTVAIKKSKVMDQNQIDQFINEVVILTQVNHRNVVKLLGCCLETEVPLLVYEFISNGTLHAHIHENSATQISWPNRLRIAIETAEALAYLHSAASVPIFHRDVKSSNILLDDKYTAKVSDFGISRLVPLDQTQIPTLVQGTLGYLDPEYFQTSQLTAKSDVYSFGVVLVELLTGQKPVSFERSQEDSNLAMYFLSSLKSKNLTEFLDENVTSEGSIEQLQAVAELARKCLLLKGDKRPTMKEVARELVLIDGFGRKAVVENEENEGLVNGGSLTFADGQDSFKANLTVTIDLSR
ncbi:wall-associated receptor kinase 3-like [Tasmannia lanceolata]|uniref:wall-associated receptor kinase 3-like n=1 Tax=Tasmannia lanceolata TaxID=3420 RepID=UPI004062C52F